MSLTGFIILYAVIWFIALWVILPIGLRTQGDEGDVLEGTHASAPAEFDMKRKLKITTIVTTLIWLPLILVIWKSGLNILEIDPWAWFGG